MPALVTAAGGTLVAPSLGLYLRPERRAPSASCRASASAARCASARRTGSQARLAVPDFADPLVPTEWWRAVIGVDTLVPPGPGGR